jgi:putative glutamine amidotransferase
MTGPTIAIAVQFGDHGEYAGVAFSRPVAAAGGVPVLLPYLEDPGARAAILHRVDGLLVSGGRDIDPARYGAQAHPALGAGSAHRDAAEIPLVAGALERGLPVLGICRGMQVLNIVRGGTLHQDISAFPPEARDHTGGDLETYEAACVAALGRGEAPEHPSHAIRLRPDSVLGRILGPAAEVNSYHHQAIDRLGSGVEAVAWADDGIIEAIELPDAAALAAGVQWELQECWQDDPRSLDVFGALVDAAAAHAAGRPEAPA